MKQLARDGNSTFPKEVPAVLANCRSTRYNWRDPIAKGAVRSGTSVRGLERSIKSDESDTLFEVLWNEVLSMVGDGLVSPLSETHEKEKMGAIVSLISPRCINVIVRFPEVRQAEPEGRFCPQSGTISSPPLDSTKSISVLTASATLSPSKKSEHTLSPLFLNSKQPIPVPPLPIPDHLTGPRSERPLNTGGFVGPRDSLQTSICILRRMNSEVSRSMSVSSLSEEGDYSPTSPWRFSPDRTGWRNGSTSRRRKRQSWGNKYYLSIAGLRQEYNEDCTEQRRGQL